MLIALLSVFLVLGVMQYFLPKHPSLRPRRRASSNRSQPLPSSTASVPATSTQPPSAGAAPASSKTPAQAAKVPVKTATSETESVLETDYYRIIFTNRGAVVKSWLLIGKNKNGSYRYTDNAGKPFDLVNQVSRSAAGLSAFILHL